MQIALESISLIDLNKALREKQNRIGLRMLVKAVQGMLRQLNCS